MFPVLQIGPLALQTPGLFLLLSVWFGLSLAERVAPRRGLSVETIYNLAFAMILTSLIGGRVSYIVQHAEAFSANLLDVFSLNASLIDPIGAIAFGLIAALIYAQRSNLIIWNTLDTFTPALAVWMIGIALSNFASGDAFGTETTLPWAINLWGAQRHPVQIYEAISAIVILIILPLIDKYNHRAGQMFLQFIALSAGARLFLEAFRGTSTIIFGQFRLEQIVAEIVLLLTLIALDARSQLQADARADA
jgi:prolipoprotein diacylglyceryl transferase